MGQQNFGRFGAVQLELCSRDHGGTTGDSFYRKVNEPKCRLMVGTYTYRYDTAIETIIGRFGAV